VHRVVKRARSALATRGYPGLGHDVRQASGRRRWRPRRHHRCR
jgi:hypothetical protein